MSLHFISDVHLDPARPGLGEILRRYLAGPARHAEALYILGDLFELWAGDDVSAPTHATEIDALRTLADTGTRILFLPGNRDFLCGPAFAERAGLQLIAEPYPLTLPDGQAALAMHGDTLCTDDRAYQRFRRIVRNRVVQSVYRALPRAVRGKLVERIRAGASRTVQRKADMIMDVNEAAVLDTFARHGVSTLIHGHTHRPADHDCGAGRRRIVLSDWSEQAGEVLIADTHGQRRVSIDVSITDRLI